MKINLRIPRTISKHGFKNLREALDYQSAIIGQLKGMSTPEAAIPFIRSHGVYQFLKLSLESELTSVTKWIDQYHTSKQPTEKQLRYKKVLDCDFLNRIQLGKTIWPDTNHHTITQRIVRMRNHPERINKAMIDHMDNYLSQYNLEVL